MDTWTLEKGGGISGCFLGGSCIGSLFCTLVLRVVTGMSHLVTKLSCATLTPTGTHARTRTSAALIYAWFGLVWFLVFCFFFPETGILKDPCFGD